MDARQLVYSRGCGPEALRTIPAVRLARVWLIDYVYIGLNG